MPEQLDLSRLQQTWVHSHEEDGAGKTVYRTPDFRFPPSRGRSAFTLRPDGVAEIGFPGADDRTRRAEGRWQVVGNVLRVTTPERDQTLEIERVEADVLVVRKTAKEQ